jgi:hypothetical protein
MKISAEVIKRIREFADKTAQPFLDGISDVVESSSTQRKIIAATADGLEEVFIRLAESLLTDPGLKPA